MRSALLFLLLPTLTLAQSPTPRPEDLGTVTGHITCADTQRPARLAQVRLVPVSPSMDPKTRTIDEYGNMLPPVQTDLSGGYTIPNVKPGQYYLRADLSGYIDPLFSFTTEEITKPTPAAQQRMQHELQLLTVAPHSTLTADATLRRGASISGTVLFDDGSPGIGLNVSLLRRDAKGIFSEGVQMWGWIGNIDDHGHYRFTGLPEGEYAVEADLILTSQETSTEAMLNGRTVRMMMSKLLFRLPVFSGSTIRRKDAAPIKLDAGQETTGVDITIPIGTLHDVSGTLLAQDGHTINGGAVALLFADDRSQFAKVDVNDDGTFHFPYVPEGDYILSVKEAKDLGSVEVPNPPGSKPPTHTEHPTLHTYGTIEQPLSVHTDLQSLTAIVPDNPSTTPNSPTGSN